MTGFEQPSIYIGSLRVDEPMTMITDLAITLTCLIFFFKLQKTGNTTRINFYYKYFFVTMAIATCVGGIIGHGFLYRFSLYYKLPGWLTSMFSIALLERVAIIYAKPLIHNHRIGNFFAVLNLIELISFVIITFYTLKFGFVELHAAYGLLIVVSSFSIFTYRKLKNKGSKMLLIAVGFAACAAVVSTTKFGFSPWFNHHDIGHTLIVFGMIYTYKAAKEMLTNPTN